MGWVIWVIDFTSEDSRERRGVIQRADKSVQKQGNSGRYIVARSTADIRTSGQSMEASVSVIFMYASTFYDSIGHSSDLFLKPHFSRRRHRLQVNCVSILE